MDLKIAVLLLAFFVGIMTTEGYIQSCCSETASRISRKLLPRAKKFDCQVSDGICDIDAVILHIKSKKLCASPRDTSVMEWLKKRKAGKGNCEKIMKRHLKQG